MDLDSISITVRAIVQSIREAMQHLSTYVDALCLKHHATVMEILRGIFRPKLPSRISVRFTEEKLHFWLALEKQSAREMLIGCPDALARTV